jgi:hypothetical protein
MGFSEEKPEEDIINAEEEAEHEHEYDEDTGLCDCGDYWEPDDFSGATPGDR